jgi:hypothetical protein
MKKSISPVYQGVRRETSQELLIALISLAILFLFIAVDTAMRI